MAFRAAIKFRNMSALSRMHEFALNRYLAFGSIRQLRGRSRVNDQTFDVEAEQFDDEIEFSSHSKALKKQISATPRKPEMGDQSLRQSMESEQFYDSKANNRSPFWNERAKQFAEDTPIDKSRQYGQFNNDSNNNYYKNRSNRQNNIRFNNNESDNEFDTKIDRDFDDNDEQSNFNTPYNRNNGQFRNFNNRRPYYNNNNNNNQFQRNYGQEGNQFRRNYDNRQYQSYDNRDNRDNRDQFKRFNNNQRNQYQAYDNRQSNQFQRFNDRNNNRYQNNFNDNRRTRDYRDMKAYNDFTKRREMIKFNENDEELLNKASRFESDDGRPRFSQRAKSMQTESESLSDENLDYDKEVLAEDEEVDADTQQIGTNEKKVKELHPIPFNVTMENRFEVLNQMLCPLHIKPYRQQLAIKYRKNLNVLQFLGKRLRFMNQTSVTDSNGLPCPLELVKPSPITEKYRNNDEYSVWPGVDGNSKTVGYFIGQPSLHNNVVCVEPDNIIVSRDSHKSLAKKFQNYLREVSPYDVCKNYSEGGNWRRLHVRSNDDGEHMLTAIMHPQQLSQQQLDDEMNRMKQYFDGDERIKSLYFQATLNTRSSNNEAPFHLISGDKKLMQKFYDKKFLVSPDTFFQVNTSAAQVLYNCLLSEVNANKKTTVLDLCCGAGVFASLVSPFANRVIGIDSSQSAINDAKQNMELNGIKNVTLIAGEVEDQLPKLLDELYSEEIVIVANPSRSGLRPSAINTLRSIKFAHKLVYMSCHPEGTALRNFVHLCAKYDGRNRDKDIGAPFIPTNAVPVDLFPHTDFCELIVTFERF